MSTSDQLRELTATECDALREQYAEVDETQTYSAALNHVELELCVDDAFSGSQPGKDAEEDIAALREVPYIAEQLARMDPAAVRAELEECGAWDDAELSDADRNLTRLLWLACGNVRDGVQS